MSGTALAFVLACVVSWISLAHAQPTAEAPRCGVVAGDAAREGYFRDLCRAVAAALGAGVEPSEEPSFSAEEARRAVAAGRVPVVFALPYRLSDEAGLTYGPVVLIEEEARWALVHRDEEERVGEVATWLFHALVQAEAWGVDALALEEGLAPDVRERFGLYEARLAAQLGLPDDALRNAIARVGHHGEIWRRWFDGDPGPNQPAELGGQLFAPPVGDR